MPNLTRSFCICGHEYDDNDLDSCPMCGGNSVITFDAESKPKKPQKPHDHTCECDQCESMQADREELSF